MIAEAEARPVVGWYFSWLEDRLTVEPLQWDFESIVVSRGQASPDLLDLGTGGGEWLAGLSCRPLHTIATEAWTPNVPVARSRLEPLGIRIVQTEAARDNVEQKPEESSWRLPFPDDSFHLVVSRHESFVAAELARVLVPGGRFVTQQVSPRDEDFARLLGLPPPTTSVFRLELALRQLEAAGFRVADSAEGQQALSFADVGALAWYLKAVPWTVAEFTPERFRPQLRRLHESGAPLRASLYAFWLEAVSG